jgi:hypothetical protein
VSQSFARWEWLLLAGLVIAVLLVYQPAWRGGFIWDDDGHVTKPELRSWYGLCRIWFELGATQQYYPLLHSAFWVEHKLWGDATLGYHLVNILLHAAAAVLVALVLRRLRVPGAYLAAAIFALHPVHVESVAWITEQKNTLSAVFYLAAMLVYLRFDQERKHLWYYGALALFVLGLFSKTTAATLPAALLVIFWWQRGRLSARLLAAGPVFCAGCDGRPLHGVGGTQVDRSRGRRFRVDDRRSLPVGGPGDLVLPGQAPLARGIDLQLPPLARQPGRVVAILIPGGSLAVVGRGMEAEPAVARTAGGPPLLRRHARPGIGIL